MTERCAMCGAVIPEGRQVCPNCERRVMSEEEKEFEYVLTLNSEQAREALKAVELLMRLKINQPYEISRAVLDGMYDRIGCDEFCKRREAANDYLRMAFNVIFRRHGEVQKDQEWYRLYNLYQVIRKAIHDAEHPEGTGVDSYEPRAFTDEPLPKIEWRKKGR